MKKYKVFCSERFNRELYNPERKKKKLDIELLEQLISSFKDIKEGRVVRVK